MKLAISLAALTFLAGCGADTKAGGSAPLDEAIVKQVVAHDYAATDPGTMVINDWKKVTIGVPHDAKSGEASGIAAGTNVTPVHVSLHRTLNRNGNETATDVSQDYLFYRDGNGDWKDAAVATA